MRPPSVDGHVGCSHLSAAVTRAAVSVRCTRPSSALSLLGHAVRVTPRCPSPARGPAVGRNSLPVCTGTAAPRGFTRPVLTRSFSQGSLLFEFCLLWFFLLDGLASHSFAGFLYVLRTPRRAHLSLCLLSIEVLKPELVTCHRCPLDHVSFENLGRKDPTWSSHAQLFHRVPELV